MSFEFDSIHMYVICICWFLDNAVGATRSDASLYSYDKIELTVFRNKRAYNILTIVNSTSTNCVRSHKHNIGTGCFREPLQCIIIDSIWRFVTLFILQGLPKENRLFYCNITITLLRFCVVVTQGAGNFNRLGKNHDSF